MLKTCANKIYVINLGDKAERGYNVRRCSNEGEALAWLELYVHIWIPALRELMQYATVYYHLLRKYIKVSRYYLGTWALEDGCGYVHNQVH